MIVLGPGSFRLILAGTILGAAMSLAAASRAIATPNVLGTAGAGAVLGWCAWAAVSGAGDAWRDC